MPSEIYIDNSDALKSFCEQLAQFEWITVDTEFLREKTYRPQLCLVQLGNPEHIACVDPLAIDDLSPMYELLNNPNITKVLHAATQDLEIFYLATGTVPAPIFDTQIAASLLGYGDQVGYGKLVEQVCKTQLDKSQSRTDWSRRPLTDRQITYAADDVRYLRDVYLQLKKELENLNRIDWLQGDFDALTSAEKYEPDTSNIWRKVKQHNKLRGVQLAVLQKLAKWREQKAVEKNKPRKWIASDDLLLDLSRTMPKSVDELNTLRSAEPGFIKHRGKYVVDLITAARETPKDQWPEIKTFKKPSPEQDALVDYLVAAAKLKSAEHQITLGSLTTRKELEKLVTGDDNIPVMKSWRYTLVGQHLKNIINGSTVLKLVDGNLSLEE